MIAFDCTKCGHTLRVKDELAGRTGHCPKCKTSLAVPRAEGKASRAQRSERVDGPRYDSGEIIPTHLEHLQIRVPLFARELQRKQERMGMYLTQAEAHAYVSGLYKEQALRIVTLVLIALLGLAALSLLGEGVVGMLIVVGKQIAWALPMCAILYFVGRYLLVPPMERSDAPDSETTSA